MRERGDRATEAEAVGTEDQELTAGEVAEIERRLGAKSAPPTHGARPTAARADRTEPEQPAP